MVALEFGKPEGDLGRVWGRAAWTVSLNKNIPAALERVKLLASISARGEGRAILDLLLFLENMFAAGRGSPDKGGHSSRALSCPQPPKAESRVPKPQSSCQPPVLFLESQMGTPPPHLNPRPPCCGGAKAGTMHVCSRDRTGTGGRKGNAHLYVHS